MNILVQIIPFTSQRLYIIPCHKVSLFVLVQKITCYKVQIICGVTHFHGKQILFCTRENLELPRLHIIKGNSVSRVPNIHATPGFVFLFQIKCMTHNEQPSQAAKQLGSVARKMVMPEIPHCCQEDDGLQFLSTNLWYIRVLLLKRK